VTALCLRGFSADLLCATANQAARLVSRIRIGLRQSEIRIEFAAGLKTAVLGKSCPQPESSSSRHKNKRLSQTPVRTLTLPCQLSKFQRYLKTFFLVPAHSACLGFLMKMRCINSLLLTARLECRPLYSEVADYQPPSFNKPYAAVRRMLSQRPHICHYSHWRRRCGTVA